MILEHGQWSGADAGPHQFDAPLAAAVAEALRRCGCRTVLDLGCGPGHYVTALRAAGLAADGFDGNPRTAELSGGICATADLAVPLALGARDAVLCLEVGEHVPAAFEAVLLDNVAHHATQVVVCSWAVPGQGGYGHVNCRGNDWVELQLADRGFRRHRTLERKLREAATLVWFRDTLMVFFRAYGSLSGRG